MLTTGNVIDVKVARALLERAGRMRYLLADKPALGVSKETSAASPPDRYDKLAASFLSGVAPATVLAL